MMKRLKTLCHEVSMLQYIKRRKRGRPLSKNLSQLLKFNIQYFIGI